MTYTPNKPDPGPSPKLDAPTIRTNFSKFASIFSSTVAGVIYNHTPIGDVNQGDHESIILTNQTNDPNVINNLVVIYPKNSTSNAGTQPQLFLRIPEFVESIDNTPMQLTYNSVNTSGPQYQSFLPGGYIVYIGSTTVKGSTITLSPAPTKILSVIGNSDTVITGNIPVDVNIDVLNNSQFVINSSLASGSYNLRYIAIAQA